MLLSSLLKNVGGGCTMIVDVDNLRAISGYLNQINNVNFDDIDWAENGVILEFDKDLLDTWSYLGLSNCDFIKTGYYKEKLKDLKK